MALPFIEGEVFFVRKALEEPRFYRFFPDDPKQFYGHMLIEHVWNRWTVSQNTRPDFNAIDRRPHPRSTLERGRAQGGWRTVFGHFPNWWINFGNDRRGRNILRTFDAQPNQNRNEMRDLDAGGPARVVFRPVPLGTEEFVFIDMTQPIRAVYFPIAYQTEEGLPNLCTYLMVDFRLRSEIQLYHPVDGLWGGRRYIPDRTWGLHYDVYHTLGIHIPSLIESISWPRGLRGEGANLYRSTPRGQETIFSLYDTDIQQGRTTGQSNFVRLIDLVTVISAHQGIDITYRPFQYRSFVADALRQIISFGLGFVPGVGTLLTISLLTISFNVGFVLIMYPDQFRDEFGPSLGFDIVTGLIESSQHFKSRSSLPRTSMALTLEGDWSFEDRMPPPTSPKYGAGPPSEETSFGQEGGEDATTTQVASYMSKQAFEDRMPPPTSPRYAAGLPSDGAPSDHVDTSIPKPKL
ncbi:MAG: hypothetical protein Q9167_005479 [Letrouitia subvulpina]